MWRKIGVTARMPSSCEVVINITRSAHVGTIGPARHGLSQRKAVLLFAAVALEVVAAICLAVAVAIVLL